MTIKLVLVSLLTASIAIADPKADRAAVATSLDQLSANAANLAKLAKASDDRGARKKIAPAATDLADDLAAAAKRLGKDVELKAIVPDVVAADKAAKALVDLADEDADKDERKSFRNQAQLIEQGIANAQKSLDGIKDGGGAAQRFTGRLINNSDACAWSENLRFVISRDGQVAYDSQNNVFPGKDVSVVLDKGKYVVQLFAPGNTRMGQRDLDVTREGWVFKSGCVNQD